MNRSRRIAINLLILAAAVVASPAWTRDGSLESEASADSYRVWIALLKGLEGEVRYVGSDETYAYFRTGWIFRSYYKVPSCAAHLPTIFSVGDEEPYIVKLHVQADNTIRPVSSCPQFNGSVLGDLDRK